MPNWITYTLQSNGIICQPVLSLSVDLRRRSMPLILLHRFSITFLSLRRQQPPTAGSMQILGEGTQASAADALWDGCLLGKLSSARSRNRSDGGQRCLASGVSCFFSRLSLDNIESLSCSQSESESLTSQLAEGDFWQILFQLFNCTLFFVFPAVSFLYLELMHVFVYH